MSGGYPARLQTYPRMSGGGRTAHLEPTRPRPTDWAGYGRTVGRIGAPRLAAYGVLPEDAAEIVSRAAAASSIQGSPVVAHDVRAARCPGFLRLKIFDGRATSTRTAAYRVRLERETYAIRFVDGELAELIRGEGGPPDVTLECDRWTMHALLRGAESINAAIRAGRLRMSGPVTPVRRLTAATAVG